MTGRASGGAIDALLDDGDTTPVVRRRRRATLVSADAAASFPFRAFCSPTATVGFRGSDSPRPSSRLLVRVRLRGIVRDRRGRLQLLPKRRAQVLELVAQLRHLRVERLAQISELAAVRLDLVIELEAPVLEILLQVAHAAQELVARLLQLAQLLRLELEGELLRGVVLLLRVSFRSMPAGGVGRT